MTYDEKIYGHPNQVQPSHIVVTSPYFDTREATNSKGDHRGEYRCRVHTVPIDEIIRLRKSGMGFKKIGQRLGLSQTSVNRWYYATVDGKA